MLSDIHYSDVMKAFRDGILRVDLPRMKLVQSTSKNARVLSGTGVIWQERTGKFHFSFFEAGQQKRLQGLRQFLGTNVAAGELIPSSHFYRLIGEDTQGHVWKSRWVDLDYDVGHHEVIRGTLPELRRFVPGRAFADYHLRLECFEKIEVPCDRTTATSTTLITGEKVESSRRNGTLIQFGDHKLIITSDDDLFRVDVVSSENRRQYRMSQRLLEAFQFTLARRIVWSQVTRLTGSFGVTTFRAGPIEPNRSRIQPPIIVSIFDRTGCVWKLFERYLAFISRHRERRWHPLSEHIYETIEASEGSIDAKALTLATSVEGVAMTSFPRLGRPPAELHERVRAIMQHVREWPGFQEDAACAVLLKRVEGLLGTLLRPRVNEVFQMLILQGVIGSDHVDAWKALRHPRAHGMLSDPRELRTLLQNSDKALVLLYKLIFAIIGYEGRYTDYGSYNWPTAEHSLVTIPSG